MERGYNRGAAVGYAYRYALKPNPAFRYFPLANTGGDCSNFLSQCLSAGGIPMNSQWWYKKGNPSTTNDDTWSQTWTIAHSLYWYLKSNAQSGAYGPKGFETTDKQSLQSGDFVYFEDNRGIMFHSAIITSISGTQILVAQHSYEALNIPYQNSWPASKIHFLKITS
jgi:hypothetical protein